MTTQPNEYVYSAAERGQPGLTKREYFAAMAMQGLLMNYNTNGMYGNSIDYPMVEQVAVRQADQLIKALNEQ